VTGPRPNISLQRTAPCGLAAELRSFGAWARRVQFFVRHLGIVALLCAPPRIMTATSGMNYGPLAGADAVEVSSEHITLGATLAMKEDTARSMWDAVKDPTAFKALLAAKVAERLKSGGLRVVASSEYAVVISMFGGHFSESGCQSQNVVLLEIGITQPGDNFTPPTRTVLLMVDDSHLATSLLNATLAVIDEFVAQRTAWRKATHQ
jgi:hypothetical protein